ncbi:MAG: ATP-binding protein [Terracidiphilus sp.]|nr:ATP-binding protein [Terracidiphilus sp.]
MSQGEPLIEIQSIPLPELAEALSQTSPFAATSPATYIEALRGNERVERVVARAGAELVSPGQSLRYYWVILKGEVHAERLESDGTRSPVGLVRNGEGFGETPLLTGKPHSPIVIHVVADSTFIRFQENQFWALLACCPAVRAAVLANSAQRQHAYQVEELHRQKLVSLGTLAAGLMHELYNPGSAAKRAASQLRENLIRLQELSLRSSSRPKTQSQMDCMHSLLETAVRGCHAPALSSLEQADAEEAMSEWLHAAGVENAFTIGPALVAIGFEQQELACARDAFDGTSFSDALNWLEALVSSVSKVCAIEESITRISDLVMAVKKFAYDDRSASRDLDVHDSLQSTLTILGHKLRMKNISVEKRFAANPSIIRTRGSALSQVWTNLIDNAVDASPQNAQIEIATWTENGTEPAPASEPAAGTSPQWLAVSIADHGPGIAPGVLPRIFEAFFTTKPQGSGTGLGLEIVHRIVTEKFGGTIAVESKPGNTRFIVRLPVNRSGNPAASGTTP